MVFCSCHRLNSEREATLRLKGENGIMRKNILGKQKEVEEQREELDAQKEQQRDLYTTIKGKRLATEQNGTKIHGIRGASPGLLDSFLCTCACGAVANSVAAPARL